MFEVSTLENVAIYLNNISIYYIISIVISLVSVFLTVYYKSAAYVPLEEDLDDKPRDSKTPEMPNAETVLTDMSPVMVKQVLKAGVPQKLLTEDQLKEEKRVEQEQLEAIFKLLQEEKNKFQMDSMDQVHDQLRLYQNH